MKRVVIVFYLSFMMLAFLVTTVRAQVPPQAFRYQTIVRDASGEPIAHRQINMRLSIIDSAQGGIVIYQELHKEGTNAFGLVSVSVGHGLTLSGSFAAIPWHTGNKWIHIELDPTGGTQFNDMGRYELLSVPYALYAGSVAIASDDSTDELQTLSISGHQLSISRGNTVTLPDNVDDADADPLNEINTAFTLNGHTLSITDAGGTLSVDLGPLSGGGSTPSNAWVINGNMGINPAIHFIGTTDQAAWVVKTNNTERLRVTASGEIGIGTSTPSASAIVDIQASAQGVLFPRLTTSQRLSIASPVPGLIVYDMTGNVLMQYNGARWVEVGAPPIGTIQAWHKSLTGTPALPWGWAECNGQIINDAESPYFGVAIPDLNNEFTTESGGSSMAGRFLRGGTVSGTMTIDQTNTIGQFRRNGANSTNDGPAVVPLNGSYNTTAVGYRGGNDSNGRLEIATRGVETYPGSMTVVWVMRIK